MTRTRSDWGNFPTSLGLGGLLRVPRDRSGREHTDSGRQGREGTDGWTPSYSSYR